MKTIGYIIFAGFFYLFRFFCSIKPKKVFGIMTHDSSDDGNVGCMVEYLRQKEEGYTFQFIRKADRKTVKEPNAWKAILSFFIIKPYHLATSEFILLDNVFLPMAYMKFSKKVKIIQLWHGTGAIKKFGQDVNTGRLRELEKRANSTITHLIINSEDMRDDNAQTFGVAKEKVFSYGLPRTDLFFDKDKMEERRQHFYKQFPELKGKTLVLYAPTFRDQEKDKPKIALDMKLLSDRLPKDYIFMLRLHPFVVEALKKDGLSELNHYDNIMSMSSYSDINTLLLVSDYLITDYSSVIFEYCLLEKPMLFYAYDLDEFSDHGRGFYRPYESYVPGPVVRDTEAIMNRLNENSFNCEQIRSFVKKNYQYMDGKAAERLYLHIFKS